MKSMALALAMCAAFAVHAEKLVKNGDTVVFMGDSITRYGGDNPHGYVNLTVAGLAANGIAVTFYDVGVPGEVAAEMRARFTRDVIDRKPAVVTISAGVNDIYFGVAEESKSGKPVSNPSDVIAMIEAAQANGIRPIVMTPTFAEFNTRENSEITKDYAAVVRSYALTKGIALADTWQAVTDWRDDSTAPYLEYQLKYKLTIDGIHMAPAGNRVMARTLLRAMGLDDSEMAKAEAAWNADEHIFGVHPTVRITPAQLATFKQAAANAGMGGGEFAKVVFKRGLASLALNPTVETGSTASDAETFSAGFSVSMGDYDTLLATSMASAYQPADSRKGYVDATVGMAMLRGLKECEAGEPVIIVPQDVDTNRFSKSITFTTSGYAGTSTLTDFPVAVRLAANSPAGFSYGDLADSASGAELRFADAAGKSLDYDVEEWDPNGTSLVWVKVPSLTKTTKFTMYYGGTPSDEVKPTRTWSADYVGVWHMAEASGSVADASGNGLEATPEGAAADAQVAGAGVFGRARVNSATRNHTTGRAMLKVSDSYLLDVGGDFTLSTWVKMTDTTDGSSARIAVRGVDGGGYSNWEVALTDAAAATAFGSAGSAVSGAIPSAMNAWVHLVSVYDGGTVSVYTNGAVAFSGAVTAASDCNYSLCFGTKPGLYNGHFTGLFDEFRLRDAVASADWVKAEYDQAGTTFLSTGPVEAGGGDEGEGGDGEHGEDEGEGDGEKEGEGEPPVVKPEGDFAKVITFTTSGYTGVSTLENFPVLVKLSTAISGFDYADFGGTTNLVFKDASGNVLPYEVDTWDTSGTSLVWVRLPEVTATISFSMYFAGSAVEGNVPADAWGADYVGVWHMGETGGGLVDATGHGLVALQKGTTTSVQTSTAGAIGGGRVNGTTTSKTYFEVADSSLLDVGDTFTISGWYNMSAANASAAATIVGRQYGWFTTDGWMFEMAKSATAFSARGASNSSNNMNAEGSMPSALNDWVHFALVYNGAGVTVYANGEPVTTSGTINAAKDNNTAMDFGYANTRSYFYGAFDEFRLRDAVASADWVKAEYDQAGAAFLANGGVQSIDVPPVRKRAGVVFQIM